MHEITSLLFDKDGTILDFYKTWIPINRDMAFEVAGGDSTVVEKLLRAGGHDPDTDKVGAGTILAAADFKGIAACFSGALGKQAPPNLPDIVERNMREGGRKYATLVDGAVEALTALAALGYRLGVATNDSAAGLQASLERFDGLLDLFEFHAGCDSGHGSKPDPGMGLAFAQAMGVDPSTCAIIGDSEHDLEMGRRAGFGLRVGVLTGPSLYADLEPHADVVIESILELARVLKLPGGR